MKPGSFVLLPIASLLLLAGLARGGEPNLADDILKMTGARTRIVWEHVTAPKTQSNDEYGGLPDFELVGFDTDERKPRVILPGPASYCDPWITPDGERVVYTESNQKIWVVDWAGTNKRKLFDNGRALATWQHPADGAIWVYFTGGRCGVSRFRLDDPTACETVWSCSKGGEARWFGVSADGTRGVLELGGSVCQAIFPDRGVRAYEGGCNYSLAPDDSYRLMMFGAPISHNGILVFDPGCRNKRVIPFPAYSVSPRWASDVRFLTRITPNAGEAAEVYLGQFDEAFTNVVQWINVSQMPGMDSKAYAWIDPGLGSYSGEAPLTVTVPAFRLPAGAAVANWGDASATSTTGAPNTHAYAKPGRYKITAQQGQRALIGRVEVQEHRPPQLVDGQLYDSTHLMVHLDKRVQLKDAAAKLRSGAAVKSLQLDAEEQGLIIELADRLGSNDVLEVTGVLDRAQVPLPLTQNKLTIARPAWPSVRDDLVVLFETRKSPGFGFDADNNLYRDLEFGRGDVSAYFDRDGVMSFHGGMLTAPHAARGLAARCHASGQMTIEALIMPAFAQGSLKQTARILCTDRQGPELAGRRVSLVLAQEGEQLVIYTQRPTPANMADWVRIELCKLTMSKPNHVVISCQPGKLVCYLNGKSVKETAEIGEGTMWPHAEFMPPELYFGSGFVAADEHRKPEYWQGKLEGVAIYARALGAEEAARNCALALERVGRRKAPPQTEVEATLAAATPVPTAKEVEPYRSALLAYEYNVDKIVKGDAKLKKVRVFQWGIVDMQPQPITQAKPGLKTRLLMESMNDHPELGAELQRDGLPEDYDTLVFVEAERFEKPEPDKPHTPTENTSIRSLPAPGKVVIDGKPGDWNLSGGIFLCKNVEQQRDTQSAWIHLMHDDKNLYVLARWRDETPMNNPKDTRKDNDGFNGDSLQFRLLADPNTPQERCVHLTCWHGQDGGDVVEIVYGRKFDRACSKEERELDPTSQALALSADGKGYIQEIAIPWALLTADGKRPALASAMLVLNYTDYGGGRVDICDLLTAGSVSAGIVTYNAPDKWGKLTFEATRPVAPQAARLADGRTFPVTAGADGLNVDWGELSK